MRIPSIDRRYWRGLLFSTENAGQVMADLTQSELKAICRVLAHFFDGGWTEILESLHEEESERLFDAVESAQEKLSRMSRTKAA